MHREKHVILYLEQSALRVTNEQEEIVKMACSHFSPSTASKESVKDEEGVDDDSQSMTILVNDKRELFYDQDAMQKVLGKSSKHHAIHDYGHGYYLCN